LRSRLRVDTATVSDGCGRRAGGVTNRAPTGPQHRRHPGGAARHLARGAHVVFRLLVSVICAELVHVTVHYVHKTR
jgi:hypothetical protein